MGTRINPGVACSGVLCPDARATGVGSGPLRTVPYHFRRLVRNRNAEPTRGFSTTTTTFLTFHTRERDIHKGDRETNSVFWRCCLFSSSIGASTRRPESPEPTQIPRFAQQSRGVWFRTEMPDRAARGRNTGPPSLRARRRLGRVATRLGVTAHILSGPGIRHTTTEETPRADHHHPPDGTAVVGDFAHAQSPHAVLLVSTTTAPVVGGSGAVSPSRQTAGHAPGDGHGRADAVEADTEPPYPGVFETHPPGIPLDPYRVRTATTPKAHGRRPTSSGRCHRTGPGLRSRSRDDPRPDPTSAADGVMHRSSPGSGHRDTVGSWLSFSLIGPASDSCR